MATVTQTALELEIISSTAARSPESSNNSLPDEVSHRTLHDVTRPVVAADGASVVVDSGTRNPKVTMLRKVIITFQLSSVNFAYSAVNGLVTVGLPKIAADLSIAAQLYFWPSSVMSLATASTLLVVGSIADVLGMRGSDLIGSFCISAFMLGGGLSQTGPQLVVMRALQGVANSMHMSASVGLIANIVPRGRARNIAFSCLGLSQPLGYSFGLVLGGLMIDTIGWRAGWYLYAGLTFAMTCIGIWALPKIPGPGLGFKRSLRKLKTEIDWVGAGMASAFMALLSYSLAVISTDVYKIRDAQSIIMLSVSVPLAPAFVYWQHVQVKYARPVLIPNALWKNTAFTSICGTVTLSYAVLSSMELFASLFFQEVQHLSALQASIRLLPSLVVGTVLNLSTGLLIDKVSAFWLVTTSSILCAGAPLLMALINPTWPYWSSAFVAQILQPISGDILFTVGLIVVSEAFPEDTQALAGAVFNMVAQFGNALGLAIMQVVSTLISQEASSGTHEEIILEGYKASFWTMFALMVTCAVIGAMGLRRAGPIGLKRE